MEILVDRQIRTPKTTASKVYVDGVFECFFLEDKDRGLSADMKPDDIFKIKVKHKTCIPTGRYQVKRTMSNRFKKMLPLLLNVPGFEGIRIHPGNTDEDTSGCLLPGEARTLDAVMNSRKAFEKLDKKIADTEARDEKIFITIK